MADLLKKYDAGSTYVEIEPGTVEMNVQPQDDIAGLRIVLSDAQPDPDHDLFVVVEPREFWTVSDIDAGFSVWARSTQPTRTVRLIARPYT